MIRPKLSIRIFFLQKKVSAQSPFFLESSTGNSWKQSETVGAPIPFSDYNSAWESKKSMEEKHAGT